MGIVLFCHCQILLQSKLYYFAPFCAANTVLNKLKLLAFVFLYANEDLFSPKICNCIIYGIKNINKTVLVMIVRIVMQCLEL